MSKPKPLAKASAALDLVARAGVELTDAQRMRIEVIALVDNWAARNPLEGFADHQTYPLRALAGSLAEWYGVEAVATFDAEKKTARLIVCEPGPSQTRWTASGGGQEIGVWDFRVL